MSSEKPNVLLVCLYCADTMDKPSQTVLEKYGTDSLVCCDHPMAEIDLEEMYKVVRTLDEVKEKIEQIMIEGL